MNSNIGSNPQQTRRSPMQQTKIISLNLSSNQQSKDEIYQFLFGDDNSINQIPTKTPTQNTQNRSFSHNTLNDNTNTTQPDHSRQRNTASILGTDTPIADANINTTPDDINNQDTPDGTGNEDNDTSMEGNTGNNDNTNQDDNESQSQASEHSPTHDSTSQEIERSIIPYFIHW